MVKKLLFSSCPRGRVGVDVDVVVVGGWCSSASDGRPRAGGVVDDETNVVVVGITTTDRTLPARIDHGSNHAIETRVRRIFTLDATVNITNIASRRTRPTRPRERHPNTPDARVRVRVVVVVGRTLSRANNLIYRLLDRRARVIIVVADDEDDGVRRSKRLGSTRRVRDRPARIVKPPARAHRRERHRAVIHPDRRRRSPRRRPLVVGGGGGGVIVVR